METETEVATDAAEPAATGFTTGGFGDWTGNIADLTAIYPFPGSEVLLVILGVIFWICWHMWQMRMENRNYSDDLDTLRVNGNMDRALKGERILRSM